MTKTLQDLTPEVRAKIPMYKERCTKDLYSGKELQEFNADKSAEYVEYVYNIAKEKRPLVIFADTPREFIIMYNVLKKENVENELVKAFEAKNDKSLSNKEAMESINGLLEAERTLLIKEKKGQALSATSHWLTEISSYSRAYFAWFYFIHKELGVETSKKEELKYLYENSLNGIMRGYFTEAYALCLKAPEYIKRNDIGFHCVDGPAIMYKDSPLYYLNGRKMEKDLFERVLSGDFTLQEYLDFDNEEDRASVATLIKEGKGEQAFLDFLGAECVDEKTVEHTGEYSEVLKLYKTIKTFPEAQDSEGNRNQPYAWIHMVCPSTNQDYLIPTCPRFTDAVECAKWHRPEGVPKELAYSWISAN